MKRLPISAALLLLLAGVWLSMVRQKQHPESIKDSIPEIGDSRSEVARTPRLTDVSQSQPGKIQEGATPPAVPDAGMPWSAATGSAPHGIQITPEFVRTLATGPEKVSFELPDGRHAHGTVDQRNTDGVGTPVGVSGRLDTPGTGSFHFRVQPAGAPTGPVVGAVVMENAEIAFRVMPGPGMTSLLAALPVDQVLCRSYLPPPQNTMIPEEIPADHPTNIPTPSYQNGIIPLQSRPGATGVIYLDFDGQTGPHEGWGNFNAAPAANMTPTVTKDIWTRVSEDFAPFNLNVTTDLQVFLNAPETSRQRCIITPTDTARPGAGGVAYVGSFGEAGDTPCWCCYKYYYTPKDATEIISHEIGHTLGLSHDGRISPLEEYYYGHGPGLVGWTPIMGVGYYQNLSQWSKGEYQSANNPQDDIAIIAANAGVGFVADDAGATQATAAPLEILANGVVKSQGNISSRTDVDAFRFTTTGGSVSLSISSVGNGADLDILASIYDSAGVLVISDNPDLNLNATLVSTLPAGDYTVRVDGTGRGNPLADGYSDYGSLGQYTITGTVNGAVLPDRFAIAENPSSGALIGTPTLHNNHAGAALTYSINSGNINSAFAIDPVTGTITVANTTALDFEALSASWDNPHAFDLNVGVTDSQNSSLDESLRVVVSVTNLNEPPMVSGPATLFAFTGLTVGTPLGNFSTLDPDNFDFASFSIASGDPSGKFAISPGGVLSTNGTLDAAVQSTYTLTVRGTDSGTPPLTADFITTVQINPTGPIPATITLGNLSRTYNGIREPVTASTNPPGLAVALTYNNSSTAPIDAGSYTVNAAIVSALYGCNTSDTLVIAKAPATIALDALSQTYDGTPKPIVAFTSPYAFPVDITYNGSSTVPSQAGIYDVTATVNDPNYAGSNSDTLEIREAVATVTLGDLAQTYDGMPKPASATTSPAGLPVYFIYNGSPATPSAAGSYTVVATIDSNNYIGGDSGTLVIAKAPATITLNNLSQLYDGTPKTVTAITSPPGLDHVILYAGSSIPPSNLGEYTVTATITDPNHSGSVSGIFTITNNLTVASGQTLTLSTPSDTYQNVVNEGTLIIPSGSHHITGNVTNTGILRLYGDAVLNVNGVFSNTGVIDTINWNGSLPPGLTNTGTILDRSAIRVLSTELAPPTFTLTVPGYTGHTYQLENSANLIGPWSDIGPPTPGTGEAGNPPALIFSYPLGGAAEFFRVAVKPAP